MAEEKKILNEKWVPVFEYENGDLIRRVIPMAPEVAQKELAKNGFDFSMDEILSAGKEIYEAYQKKVNGELELSETDLEEVAGGGNAITVSVSYGGVAAAAVPAAAYAW